MCISITRISVIAALFAASLAPQSRATTLKVPGSALGVELIEYKDIDRKPAQPRFQDPDGFFIELSQRTPALEITAPPTSNVIGGNFEIIVADMDKTMRLYKEAPGLRTAGVGPV